MTCIYVLYVSGIIPVAWRRYTIPAGLTVIQWITDFSARVKQLQEISEASQSGGASALKVSQEQGGFLKESLPEKTLLSCHICGTYFR